MPALTQLSVSRTLATSPRHMVAAKHPLAVEAALEVLERGGNAVDAAATAAFAVGVLEPWMSGLGGGGFVTVQLASGERALIDYFATAPAAAQADLYRLTQDFVADGVGFSGVQDQANAYGALSVATPGMVRGMELALQRFGTLELNQAVEPAIRFAEQGFAPDWYQGMLIASELDVIRRDADTARIFLENDLPRMPRFGAPAPVVLQTDLGWTLRQIARDGAEGFYGGEVAERVVAHVRARGGILSLADLATYRPRVREPLVVTYRDIELVLLPFQAGGSHTAEALHILEDVDLRAAGHNTAATLHHIASASRRASADRVAHVGDPDFVAVDWPRLTSAQIETGNSRSAAGVDGCTTHLSVVDRHGNMASLTQTLTLLFGSGMTVPGTGVLLNDSMNLFDPRPGGPNSIAPGKRPVSNMAHLIALREGVPVLAVGAPGGRRILDTCLQMAINSVDFGMDVQAACSAPLIDCSGPTLLADDRLSPAVLRELGERGHAVEPVTASFLPRQFASPTGVAVDSASGLRSGGADPWAIGVAAGS